ncbi:hypothetical protein BDZ97DRAFT_1926742 [Flammula alnicola]|nr:hypothetical protein BDZ97DRAFT_1926742 [Flammula alnicola]
MSSAICAYLQPIWDILRRKLLMFVLTPDTRRISAASMALMLVLSPFVEAELLARACDAASGETDYTQDPVALEHALGHVRSELHNYSFRIQYELQQYDNANQSIQKLQEALDRVRISRK